MPPPARHEAGWVEEKRRAVEAKLRQIRLARRRLGDLKGTLAWPAAKLVDTVLYEFEEDCRSWLEELQ